MPNTARPFFVYEVSKKFTVPRSSWYTFSRYAVGSVTARKMLETRLGQLLELHHLYFKRPDPAALIPIDARVAHELCRITRQSGHYAGPITGDYDQTLRQALETLVGDLRRVQSESTFDLLMKALHGRVTRHLEFEER